MSYPKRVNKFIPWSKAMVAGATVDRPDYHGGKMSLKTATQKRRKNRRRKSRKRRMKKHGD